MPPFRLPTGGPTRTQATPTTGGPLTLGPGTGGGLAFEPQLSGNVQIQGDVDSSLAAAGATNVLGSTPSFVDQFLNPELNSDQQKALDAFRKTAIGRGLSGAGLDAQLQATEQRLLAGQKLSALQNLIGNVRARADAFRDQIAPFFESRGSVGKASVGARGASGAAELPGFPEEVRQALLGGLTSLGFGDAVRGELFRATGAGEAGRLTGLRVADQGQADVSRLLTDVFNPRSAQAKNVATGNLLGLFKAPLKELDVGLTGLQANLLGGQFANPTDILNADLSQFQDLLGLFQT